MVGLLVFKDADGVEHEIENTTIRKGGSKNNTLLDVNDWTNDDYA